MPAARKKGVDNGFSVEASIKDGSAKCAKNQQSYGKHYRGLEGAMATAKAQRSKTTAAGENRGRKTTTTASRLLKDGQEARGSHDGAFSRASATPQMATTR